MNRDPADGITAPADANAVSLTCRVTRADVDAMLDAYDSGMCDITTGNCLSRAVARLLNRRQSVPLIRQKNGASWFQLDGRKIPVPPEIVTWLASAEIGGQTGPIEFALAIPRELLPASTTELRQFPIVLVSN